MKDVIKALIFMIKMYLYGFIVAAVFAFIGYKITNSIIPIGFFLYIEALGTMINGVWMEIKGKSPLK